MGASVVTKVDEIGRNIWKPIQAGLALVIALTLTACGSSGGLLGTQDQAAQVAPKPVAAPAGKAQIAIAPVIGAPTQISQKLAAKLTSQAQARSVSVGPQGTGKSDYTIRGYVVAAPDAKGTKLSYIWDVTDPGGKRKQRFVGEEVVVGKKSKDPWQLVNDTVIDRIATKTAGDIAGWLPKKSSSLVASAGTQSAAAAPASAQPVPASVQRDPIQPVRTGETRPIPVKVLPVEGAPGDGKRSLTNAIREQLRTKGLPLASIDQTGSVYTVRGVVKLGAVQGSSQDIKIDWTVVSPNGQNVGTVSQSNAIAKGSLDGPWGDTANRAAGAAADGIVKLIPKKDRPAGKAT